MTVILGHLLPFYSPKNTKNQNFEKIKKIPGDIIILLMCIKNQSHDVQFLRYGVRWTEFFIILSHLLPFCPLMITKIKYWKNKKKMPREIILLHMCTINEDHMITDASKRISIPVCPENEIYTFLYTEIFNAGYVSFF